MNVAILGPLEVVTDDGRPVEVGGPMVRALLVRLALDARRLVTVDALVDGLWGESPPGDAGNALQSLVSRLRRALRLSGEGPVLGSRQGGYVLEIGEVDAHRFERLAAEGRSRLAAGDHGGATASLRQALALWRGPALADAAQVPFSVAPAARLEEMRLSAMEERFEADLLLGRHAEVVAELESLAGVHPLRERLRGQLMRALAGTGRQADALATYEHTRRLLASELGIEPSAELGSLHLAVLRGDPALLPSSAQSPLLRSPGVGTLSPPAQTTRHRPPTAEATDQGLGTGRRPARLRLHLTSFLGRDTEVRQIAGLLQSTRLVTLVGPGGVGKTRLAEEVVARSAELLPEGVWRRDLAPDGVWPVELAPVREPADVPEAVLTALGIREMALLETGPAPAGAIDRLTAALGDLRLLILLDNCEHVIDAAATLADRLTAACPGVRILATSREPLGVPGETLWPTAPLRLPPPWPHPPTGAALSDDHLPAAPSLSSEDGHGLAGRLAGPASSGDGPGLAGRLAGPASSEDGPGLAGRLAGPASSEDGHGLAGRLVSPASLEEGHGLVGRLVSPASSEDGHGLARALASPAVRLFADRAKAVRPGFTVDETNVAAVVEICRHLDGLPLAIELAAARVRSLAVPQIAARLGDRFRLLAAGSRTASARHRTLSAVIEWSWRLLSEPEQILARRLSVFPGGVTPESAEEVCAGDGLAAAEVLHLLAGLVDKSLLEPVREPVEGLSGHEVLHGSPFQPWGEPLGETVRYRMLETVRVYAAERLAEAGEADFMKSRHARHFLRLAEEAEPRLRTAGQVPWVVRLSSEHDNLLAALRHAVGVQDAETAVRFAAALAWFWTLRGHQVESTTWIAQTLALPGATAPAARAVARAFHALMTTVNGGRDSDIVTQAALIRRSDEAASAHPVMILLESGAAMVSGDHARALQVLDRDAGHPDPWARAVVLLMRAFVMEQTGEGAHVEGHLARALQAFREIGDRWGLLTTLSALAEARGLRGDHSGAIAACTEAIDAADELRAPAESLTVLIRRGVERGRHGDLGAGLDELTRALSSGRCFGENLVLVRCGLGELTRRRGDLPGSRRHYELALAHFDAHAETLPERLRGLILIGMGWTQLASGDVERARTFFAQAVELGARDPDPPVIAGAAEGTAALTMSRPPSPSPSRAALLLGVATALRGVPDLGQPEVTELTAKVRVALGREAYQHAYERGARMSREEAIAFLRS
ncbi:AfsR/SARP family transcriptional regulator [Sphaerisporangium fuscum]|uniref:AfsR/SARP family transcriptional regulator n=1 Tax=Sphaerisporangium fuscum TaxID=2835868 RepID=UPI001BDC1671|nr:BTAD domain-containing putative transcriptional regulator [Sphaerisporangium fuscum]